ncbi:2-keto-4-pentenoate hydratase [Cytobacillus eiseniae]|uniref:2-keto-4-pentenoate hydratase n=1 Tax=Cytobacillus eiseniae TaxID=762947 RepID=A0ABS4RIK4_9BACI|nr:hypothetical protein [Cytobacillus eiseniae]MBP2242740.1 2-keto-4-pentenoate hydratase [Cytobacillus eiseniae]
MGNVQETVSTILDVYQTRQPLAAISGEHFSKKKEYYDVQHTLVQRKMREYDGEVKGFKISLTNTGLQEVFKTDSPVYGTLLDRDVLDVGTIFMNDFFDPLIEAELMFIVQEDISLDADEDELLAKTIIAPGLELPDSRIKNWFPHISVGELIMDNAVTGKVIVGEPKKWDASIPLADLSVKLFYNDQQVAEGTSSFVLENPIHAVKWLHQELASQNRILTKGMIISSGTFIKPLPLKVGTYRVVFDHFGEITLNIL